MKCTTPSYFRCTYCGREIPWEIRPEEIGIFSTDEPKNGNLYPYEKCPCGNGKFVQYLSKNIELKTVSESIADLRIKEKIEKARYKKILLSKIVPNSTQPRRFFDKTSLQSLAKSISTIGLLEDIMVRKVPNSTNYEIVVGERRWRAAVLAGITKISCKIVDLTDEEVKIISLVENLQRENLTEVEEAFSFMKYLNAGITINELGMVLGMINNKIAQRIKLLHTASYIKYQDQQIEELENNNKKLKESIVKLQNNSKAKFDCKILKSKKELVLHMKNGWEFVTNLGENQFLIRKSLG